MGSCKKKSTILRENNQTIGTVADQKTIVKQLIGVIKEYTSCCDKNEWDENDIMSAPKMLENIISACHTKK